MTSEISHAFSLVLYYLAGILLISVDELCMFEYLILAGAGTDFWKSWCREK